mmetsp:Transcript_28771/g.60278  ORF Transcript_28771/g.60278 Transcript_28771/m.60278 type:complete len:242 (+) Transcript_28771:294-1019(+)
MKRFLTFRREQQQQLSHRTYLGSDVTILENCRPLINERENNDRDAKRQKSSHGKDQFQLLTNDLSSANPLPAPQHQQGMMALLTSAMTIYSSEQQEQRESNQDQQEAHSTEDASASTQDQDKKADASSSNTAAAIATITNPSLTLALTRRASRSISFCEDDVYKSYQMELPKSVVLSLNDCDNSNFASTNRNSNHHGHCHLPSQPRLPRPNEIIPMIAPTANEDNDEGSSVFMKIRIYGAR